MKQLIIKRILDIIKLEGGQHMKGLMKWENVKFKNKHISDLTAEDFENVWLPDFEILDFYDKVKRQYNKQY